MRVGGGVCVSGDKRGGRRCTWINDVLEQVHKLEGLMFASKDNVVLIGEVWA